MHWEVVKHSRIIIINNGNPSLQMIFKMSFLDRNGLSDVVCDIQL